ncbi:hypothetical protein GCM10011378_30790 [Hymenobacter glacieicola]|uniref:Spore coat protein n=1 Tax=Hymenobacter glacieicola TaxID=1562124 RepID=A0ABQ1X045_9BACT|nr:hypothetical protein GCM10011378_30790 [Hymenobacter glacieicola]
MAAGPGPYYGSGYGYRPRPYYQARPYYRPVPPRVVIVEPHRRVVAPAPRPYYNARPHRYIRVR